ncbi:MAG: S-adenosylmethionine/S-adenosylhomocysteine transporter [Chlamydiae bacterium]|nr:S-adenosylmethionine/S-adenosylhomocysteine transporter [Chlamydiota bacterium]
MYLIVLLYALFASVFTISKTGLQYTEVFFFVGTRMLLGGATMLLFLYFFQRDKIVLKKKLFWSLLLLAFFNIYLTNVCEFWGLKYLTSFKTCFIYSLSPFIAALFSYLILSEKMTSKKWLGLGIGFLGILPVLLHETTSEEGIGHIFFFSWAEIAVMIAAASSVYGWILLRQLVKEEGMSPVMANGVSMLMGGGMALTHSYFAENWNPVPVLEFFPFLECTILLIIISNLICYNLYGHLLRNFTATFMSFAGFITPMFTALFGWWFLGEDVTSSFFLSAIVVFFGLSMFYQEELKQGYYVQPGLG